MRSSFKFLLIVLIGMVSMTVGASTIPPEHKQEVKFTQVEYAPVATVAVVNYDEVGNYAAEQLSTHLMQPEVINEPVISVNSKYYMIDYGLARLCHYHSVNSKASICNRMEVVNLTRLNYPQKTSLKAPDGAI